MSEELGSLLVGTVPLDLVLLLAAWLTWARGPGESSPAARGRVLAFALPALAWQVVHFAEELTTGLSERLPALLGLPVWPVGPFVGFNLAWIAIWGLSLVGLRAGLRLALLPLWFLAIGCTLNGVIHPLLALAAGGYFPGLWTSPVSGVVGWLLLLRLGAFTRTDGEPAPAAAGGPRTSWARPRRRGSRHGWWDMRGFVGDRPPARRRADPVGGAAMSVGSRDPLYDHCRSLPGVTEDVKWGDNLVFSVGGKMFAVFDCPEGAPFSFRVEPEAFSLLTQQPGIRPAPYLARHSWVQVERRDTLPREVVRELLQESHALVAARLPKRLRAKLGL